MCDAGAGANERVSEQGRERARKCVCARACVYVCVCGLIKQGKERTEKTEFSLTEMKLRRSILSRYISRASP